MAEDAAQTANAPDYDDDSNNRKGGDDKCIGNRRVRNVIISILMIIFSVCAIPLLQSPSEQVQPVIDACDAANRSGGLCETHRNWKASAILAYVGAVFVILGSLLVIVASCIGENRIFNIISGFVVMIGSTFYGIGWWWLASEIHAFYLDPILFPIISDERQRQLDALLAAQYGEALLPALTAFFVGLDCVIKILDNEGFRIASNLSNLCAVSFLCFMAYYLAICEDGDLCDSEDSRGSELIAAGYTIVFIASLVYVVLWVCTCCTCDFKDRCGTRVVVSLVLVLGGVLTAIGYWVHVGGDNAGTDDHHAKVITYYVGYSILVGTLCVIWAGDLIIDDIKND